VLISEVGLPFHIITIGTAVLTLSYGTSRCSGCRLLLLLLSIIFCGEAKTKKDLTSILAYR